jgi:hypothetical protein
LGADEVRLRIEDLGENDGQQARPDEG